MASLYDVAKRAGVSKTLVSRVIGNKKGVSQKSREKILAAMKELQYTPNELARSLVRKRTYTIGVILDSLCEPYFFDLISGIEQEVAKTEYNVIFCSGHGKPDLKNRYIHYMTQGRVDGAILFGSQLDDEDLIKQIAATDFPIVVAENNLSDLPINNIIVDNLYGSKLAVDHLFACGCQRIYHVLGDERVKVALDRYEGYCKAMKDHGIHVTEQMLIRGKFDVEPAYNAMSEWIRENGVDHLPDGFYCGSDKSALGVMMALQDAGVSVPQQVQIVGFDDDKLEYKEYPPKKLTTLSQPLYEVGKAAVDILIDEIEGKNGEKKRMVFQPKLIVRDTTKERVARD